ncbi:MAG: fibronectin type III domain-containing protein, partial [Verrucomicrobiales bacterium]|nr:fibronectin type III domain-containing protein [Verrucomicrobiales bacterium]
MRLTKRRAVHGLIGALSLAGAAGALAGQQTWDFSTDPTTGAAPLKIGGNGVNPGEWQQTGGNPGGFLAVTWPINSSVSQVNFPNIDPGKVVTAFTFKADLRVGNSTGDRAADGFSVSFARDGDPVLLEENLGNQGVFAGGIAEGGTTTGIAVCFDTWSGNTLPDGADIEGIIVRVDNKTILRQALPTRHGACDDATSLQTGPRNAQYWTDGGEPTAPEAYNQLCWQPLEVSLTGDAKLSVSWKGRKLLDNFQTTFFPTAGQIVLAGRTGNANENTHFDNISLTTTAEDAGAAPTAPGDISTAQLGARRVLLSWGAATVPGNPQARVGYEVEVDGTIAAAALSGTSYEITPLKPQTQHTARVRAKNVAGVTSDWKSITFTTAAETDGVGFLLAKVFRTDSSGVAFGGAAQDGIDTVINDAKWPNSPDSEYYVNGLSFGEPNFGDTYGENHMVA